MVKFCDESYLLEHAPIASEAWEMFGGCAAFARSKARESAFASVWVCLRPSQAAEEMHRGSAGQDVLALPALSDWGEAMKGLWASGLSVALGWLGTAAAAEPVPAGSGVSLGRPIAVLGKPTAPNPDAAVRRISYLHEKPSALAPTLYTLPLPPLPDGQPLARAAQPARLGNSLTTSFATEPRLPSSPLVVASTKSTAPGGDVVPTSLKMGVSKYLLNVSEVLGITDPSSPLCCDAPIWIGDESFPVDGTRWYGSAEYLLWQMRGTDLPPLVTTGPLESQGILGQPGTTVLFGGRRQDEDWRNGGRFTLGWWCDPCQQWGVEASYFFLGQRSQRFTADSATFSLLARPFFNVNQQIEFSEITARPGDTTGNVIVELPSRLWGLQGNVQHNLCRRCDFNLDFLAGVRYLSLEEGLDIRENLTLLRDNLVPGFPAGTRAVVFDQFNTRNQFYGGQLGARAEVRRGPWFANVRGTVALGNTHQVVNIFGGQVFTAPNGGVSSFRGGLLALPTNLGNFSRDRFSVVPEIGVNLGYQVGPRLRLFVGYNFLYWSNVLRPGDQIDRTLDINQIPNFTVGPNAALARPIVPFKSSDFWAQGVNFGIELRY